MTFVDAVKTDGVDARTLFWMLFKVWSLDVLRVRNPAAYALVQIANLATEDEETILADRPGQAHQARAWRGDRGRRRSMGATVLDARRRHRRPLVTFWHALGGVIDVIYGWDPDPEDVGEAAVIASRALTVVLDADELGGVRPALTLIGVPAAHGARPVRVDDGGIPVRHRCSAPRRTRSSSPVPGSSACSLPREREFVADFAPSIRVVRRTQAW